MGDIKIYPSKLKGILVVPPSKSICHRALICSGLSDGVSNLKNIILSDDIIATSNALSILGSDIKEKAGVIIVNGVKRPKEEVINIDCKESGSTLRFLTPIVAAMGFSGIFTGMGRLVKRPLGEYYKIFNKQNFNFESTDNGLPLKVNGKLKADIFEIDGNISSQFVSGLLFAAPLLDGESRIILTSDLESKPYVDLTIEVLKKHSIEVENKEYREFYIRGNQQYKPSDYEIEGDFSQAAFWLAANLVGAEIECRGLNYRSIQGDKMILEFIKEFNNKSSNKDITLNVSECPDLVPILAVIAAVSEGTTKIVKASRLRYKESDRLKAVSTQLNHIGGNVVETEDGLFIKGKTRLKGGCTDSWNDHRIAMALAIASIKCGEPLIIKNADCVRKSYPNFWNDFRKLGGNIDGWNLG